MKLANTERPMGALPTYDNQTKNARDCGLKLEFYLILHLVFLNGP